MVAWGVLGPTWAPRCRLTASDNFAAYDPSGHIDNNDAIHSHFEIAVGNYVGDG